MGKQTLRVQDEENGMRLDLFVCRRSALSRARAASLIAEGLVGVGGEPVLTRAVRLRYGQEVSVVLPDKAPLAPAAAVRRRALAAVEVLFEDEHLLGFVKPAGLITHPAPSCGDKETMVDRLIAHSAPALAGYPHEARCGIVHRLDKDTSGVMLAAKTEQARSHLIAMFAKHRLERSYLALVWGVPRAPHGTLQGSLARHPKRPRMTQSARGKPACTQYALLKAFGDFASLLRCRLETGRTHQIRVHLSHLGHKVIGDRLYGRGESRAPDAALRVLHVCKRQALHAERLVFRHPITNQDLDLQAPPPEDFQNLQQALESVARESVARESVASETF